MQQDPCWKQIPKRVCLLLAGDGALRIMELQMVGGRRMAAKDYLRGHQIALGTKLEELMQA